MAKTFTVQDFYREFPDDDACLDHLMKVRFGEVIDCPKCGKNGKFHRLRKEPAYACQWCGHHLHPMVGTPFEDTHTPLQKWFYAMYLFTTTRHGVPAKELQRQLGVTYKTAWRMGHEIRKYLAKVDGNPPLGGHVEIDETLIGGRERGAHNRGRGSQRKTTVLGMVERDGNIMTAVVTGVSTEDLLPPIMANVKPGAVVSTDEFMTYRALPRLGYLHGSVNHARVEWVRGIHHTNSIEGFWSQIKRSIRGTHVHVSRKHLAKYLCEFEFRYNMRKCGHAMFPRLLQSF